jgi:hypothetical protein
MPTFTRNACSQQCTHGPRDSPLAANHFPKIIWCNMEFQDKGVSIIAHFAHLYSRWIIDE